MRLTVTERPQGKFRWKVVTVVNNPDAGTVEMLKRDILNRFDKRDDYRLLIDGDCLYDTRFDER